MARPGSQDTPPVPPRSDPWAPRARAAALALTGVAVSAAPLLIGGAPLWASGVLLALVSGAAGALLMASAREGEPLTISWTGWLLVALVGWEALQLVPLPPGLLGLISPHGAEVQALSLGELGGWPAWRPVSLSPVLTRLEVARHLSWTVLFLVARSLAVRSGDRLPRLLGVSLAVGVGLALLQGTLGLTRIYGGWPTPPGGLLFAGFVNPNHFGAWLDLMAPLALALALGATQRATRFLWSLLFVLALVVCLFTLSRGAIAALGVALVGFAALNGQGPRRRRVWGTILLAGAVALAGWLGLNPVLDEVSTLVSAERLADEARWPLWAQVLDLTRAHWATGVGRGAFGLAFPGWATVPGPRTYTHAENQALHLAAELGVLPALGVVAAVGVWWTRAARRRPPGVAIGAALLAGLAALAVHELADFATALAGVAMPALVVMAWVDSQVFPARRLPRGAVTIPAALGVSAALFLSVAGNRPDEALAGLQRRLDAGDPVGPAVLEVARRSPADHMPHLVAARALLNRGDDAQALRFAARAMRLGRSDPRAHLLAAESLARTGRLDQAKVEWRLAVTWGHPAREILEQAVAHLGPTAQLAEAVPDTRTDQLAAARYLQHQGAAGAAAEVLERLSVKDPAAPEVLDAWARALLSDRRPDRAEAVARRWREVAPDDPQAALVLARTLWAQGQAEAAEALTGALLTEDAPLAEAALLAAELALHHRRPAEALERLDRVRPEGVSQRARLHLLRGDVHQQEGRTVDAAREWRLAARVNPRWGAPWVRLGDLWLRVGQPEAALEAFQEAQARLRAPSEAISRRIEAAEAASASARASALESSGRALGLQPVP